MAGDDRGGWQRQRQPASAYPVRALWPWTFPTGSRPVPVVGPTEALRKPAGGPGMAVPPAAVAGLLDPAQRSSWQLAQEVWQESGVTWERTAPELADVEPAAGSFPVREPGNLERLTDAPPNPGLPSSEPAYLEPSDPEPATATAWLTDPDPADGWLGGMEPEAPELGTDDPAGFDPVADEWFADPEPEAVRPADTWFTGVGPADPRFADARSADPGRADARPQGGRPTAAEDLGPFFADSGLVPPQSEFPTRDDLRPAGRAPRPGPAWNEYPPDGFPGQAWPAGSGRVPLGAPVALDPQAPESVGLTGPFSAMGPDGGAAPGWAGGAPLSEPDELFRAWQGSVNEAASARGPWSVPRRAASASRRRRALQAAAIGVPVAVIVTVGAGALMMLTGKANEMLAVRADTGSPSPAATATATSGARIGARATGGAVPPAFAGGALSGYPGQRGAVTVASIKVTAGATVAVGTADGHPAIWRRSRNGSWPLVSGGSLTTMAGSAGLTSVTHGPAGWIAVGSTSDGGATEPVVVSSADGVQWQPVAPLAARAGAGTEFLGAVSGPSGYVVVGRQMVGGRTFAVLWYSADLRSWTADGNGGLDGRLEASTANAVAATADGFVAVGSHGAVQSIWTSSDGRHWQLSSVSLPAGAASATLGSVAATGTRVLAGGYAATPAGDIPVAVVSTDGGGQWRQIVLPSPDGLGVITALTATPDGFTAAGLIGRGGSQHAVTWTSPDGLTWSRPAQSVGSEITALAFVGTSVAGTAEQGTAPTFVALPAP